MNSDSPVLNLLRKVVESSSLQYADLASGTADGMDVRFRYTADSAASVGDFPRPPALDLPSRDLRDRRYLIASITKPVVAMAAVQLAAEGYFSLNEPVRDFVEGFHRGPLRSITFRHLLTHTSGLPDMLVDNNELRAQHATLEEFAERTCRVAPEFSPGTSCRYSSMGFAVLAMAIQRLTQESLPELLHSRIFQPLEMSCSWLGLPIDRVSDLMQTVVPCELPAWQETDSDWNWNSQYWRTLGAPWGGMISTVEDLGKLAADLLKARITGRNTDVFCGAAVHAATRNQTRHFSALSEADRVQRPWGFGWRLNWPDHASCFSEFLPARAFGHWGATGTLMWIDPRRRRWCVILTNQPFEQSMSAIQRMSGVLAAADFAKV